MVEFKNITINKKYNFPILQTEIDDPLTIYDGPNDKSTLIAKLSGYLGSFIVSSTGNSLFVKFESSLYHNYKGNYNGFLATIHYGNPYLNIK